MEAIIGADNPMQQQGSGRRDGNNQPPRPPPQKCPRCDSFETKFCYYNNYSLTQPRYYCKACRRYWTHGGTLRNVPIGGGCRKSKRVAIRASPARAHGSAPALRPPAVIPPPPPPMGGSFRPGGAFLPSLAAMQPAANVAGGQFVGNVALLHRVSLPLRTPAAARQFEQPPTSAYFLPPPSGEFNPWRSQGFVSGSSSAAAAAGDWSCNTGNDQTVPSFAPNQWTGSRQGFDPSQ